MELVDMRDLGSRAAMRVGSSPFRRTRQKESEPALIGAWFGFFSILGKRDYADGIKANRWTERVSGLAHQLKEWLLS